MRVRPVGLLLIAAGLWTSGCSSPDTSDGGAEGTTPAAIPATARPSPYPTDLTVETDSVVDRSAPGLVVAVSIPRFAGLAGAAAPDALTAASRGVRDSVEAFVAGIAPTEPPGPDSVTDVYETTGDYETTLFQDALYSGVVRVITFSGGAHPNTFYLGITRDLRTGAPVPLADLFRPGAPYLDTLAAHVARGAVRHLTAQGRMTPVEARDAVAAYNPDGVRLSRPVVTLTPGGLRVHVAPYDVMAYAAGSFAVDVPWTALDGMLAEAGPIARLRR